MNIIDELKARNILNNITNLEKFKKLDPKKTGVYCGFDPTAESLHLGNYIVVSILKRFMQYGFNVYGLIGGATGMIGDPSFRDTERVLLNDAAVAKNKNKIKKQLENFGLKVLDNYDFYKNINVIDFLRDTGKLINVSYMLAKDSVQSRLERGLSFTEFSYQLLQGNDFLQLYKRENIKVQIGGSDQWGNITTGLEMISKEVGEDHDAVAVTFNLLTDESGKKIGKSSGGGSLWINKKMTSPFKMYQYLFNQADSKIEELLNWLTFLKLDDIKKVVKKHFENPSKHYAQEVLASEVVRDIFGEKELKQAQNITKILYDKKFKTSTLKVEDLKIIENYLPVVKLKINDNIIDKLIENKHIQSNREAREFIQNKALKIDDDVVTMDSKYAPKNFSKKYAFFKKGKKQTILLKTE